MSASASQTGLAGPDGDRKPSASALSGSIPNAEISNGLREARALIERGWCQHDMRNGDCVCIRGALLFTFRRWDLEMEADKLLKVATGFQGYLGDWNDAPERTQADVLAAFDKAIELAELSA
jgi:hypothetical protein